MGRNDLSAANRVNAPRLWPWAAVVFIFVATFVVYVPALNGRFLWDDDGHITKPELRSLDGLYRIWFELGASQQYYPLLHSAFWVQHKLWGDATPGYHVVNVLMHAGVAWLMLLVLRRLGFEPWAAFLAAAVFALHPVHVESVAWITEQKNTLSGLFYLSAMLVYLRFDQSRRLRHYFAAIGLFALGLLTKTVVATLPAALLIILWWRRGKEEGGGLKWKRDIQPLEPWFVLGAAAGLFTAWVEYAWIGAQGEKFSLSVAERFLLAGRAVWFYLGKLLWPVDLTFIYPRWSIDPAVAWQWLLPLGVLGLLIALAVLARRWRGPLAAMLLFIGTLFPVLGFFNVYPFIFSYVADHFQYLASMSVISLMVGLLVNATARVSTSVRGAVGGGLFVLVIVLGALSFGQSRMYADAVILYQTTLERNPGCWLAHNNLGSIYDHAGDLERAMSHFQRALELRPDYGRAHMGLGVVLRKSGRLEEALPHLQDAVRYLPYYPLGHYNLGLALRDMGRTQDAITQFVEALQQKADYVEVMNDLGVLYAQTGRFENAIKCFSGSLAIEPDKPHILMNLALAYDSAGRSADALAAASKAVKLARLSGQDEQAARIQAWINAQR